METEIKDMLFKLLEGQTRLEGELSGIKSEISGIKGEIKTVKEEVRDLKGEVKIAKEEISNLKGEVKKNSIKLEGIEKKLDVITEVQTSHKEQNEREFDKSNLILEEKTNLIHSSVKIFQKM